MRSRRPAAFMAIVLIGVLGLAGCRPQPEAPRPPYVSTVAVPLDEGWEMRGRVYVPSGYSDGTEPFPLMLYFHGNNGDETELDAGMPSGYLEDWLTAGYVVATGAVYSPTGARTDLWGSQRATTAYRALFDRVREDYNVRRRVVLNGTSMGPCAALYFAKRWPESVSCIIGGCPVIDLLDLYDYAPAFTHYDDEMDAAYGSSGREEFKADYVPIWSPSEAATTLAVAPMLFLQGDADPVTRLDDVQRFAEDVRSAGGSVTLRVIPGLGHDYAVHSARDEIEFANSVDR